LKYVIKRVQGNHEGLKFNGTHKLLTYYDDVFMAGENIDCVKQNTEALLDALKEVGQEVHPEKT
jgi:hypothetical protein